MTENGVYYGRGNAGMFDEYMDFINYVFGFNGNSSDFKKLLPKLYKYEYDPAGNSYVAVENGKLKSAIGAFDHDISVCGEYIKTRGIGNVAVHPYERSRGFMRKLLNMSIDDMINDGVVLSVLGGRRQRYNYFGYDKLGAEIELYFNSDNMRHTFGQTRERLFSFKKVGPADSGILESIKALSESKPFYALRDPARYYEILVSWKAKVYAVYAGEEFAGYCILKDTTVTEVLLADSYKNEFAAFARDLFDELDSGKLKIILPVYLSGYIAQVRTLAEDYAVEAGKSFCVLDYCKVTSAFMKLAAEYMRLPDGELTLDVDGRAGRENITLSVKDGVPSVERTEKTADLKLGHLEAMNLLFAPYDPARLTLPDFARVWFPLPLWIYSADTV